MDEQKKKAKARIDLLRKNISQWNTKYYSLGQSDVSDELYDAYYLELKTLERKYPEFVSPDSPTKKVGAPLVQSSFEKVKHSVPMLSLENAFGNDELDLWFKRLEKNISLGDEDHNNSEKESFPNNSKSSSLEFVAELKIDGVSISLLYENGQFIKAITRGDGLTGEDVTENVRTINSLPQKVEYKGSFEVRGEVLMTFSTFKTLEGLANPRNATAGSLKLLDPKLCAERKLSLFTYQALGLKELRTHWDNLQFLKREGFTVNPLSEICSGIDEVKRFCEKANNDKKDLDYPTDGVVVKVNDLSLQESVGSTSKYPRWAIAYKFAAEEAETIVENITVEVGRLGTLTPVAELKPVLLAGTIVKRASLHNADLIQELDVRIGDYVIVRKAGEIIPEVVSVAKKEKRGEESLPFHFPETCPSCGTKVVKVESEVAIRCPNSQTCPAQIHRRIEHWASKSAMDIKGLGESIIAQLVQKNLINEFADIYLLKAENLLELEGFKDKSVDNLLSSIQESKSMPLDRVIFGLGIKHVGANTAKIIAKHYSSTDELMNVTKTELIGIDGVGDAIAEEIESFFRNEENRMLLERLKSYGLKMESVQENEFSKKPLLGQTFVITGMFEIPRSGIEEMILKMGGKVSSSVSKKTNYLILGEEPGSKLEKAKKFQTKIISLQDLRKMLNEE
ncbi:MAG: NAD-dependent DNA ligase LigA [Candidatus Caenarcaniphilales bacterium]|nr:NAD-dependent DNA ligase LigA [Candidatus Caenarcaniphilales bacterium]